MLIQPPEWGKSGKYTFLYSIPSLQVCLVAHPRKSFVVKYLWIFSGHSPPCRTLSRSTPHQRNIQHTSVSKIQSSSAQGAIKIPNIFCLLNNGNKYLRLEESDSDDIENFLAARMKRIAWYNVANHVEAHICVFTDNIVSGNRGDSRIGLA